MQFDAIEAGLARACRRIGKKPRQHHGQGADVLEMQIGDPLAIAVVERFQFRRRQDLGDVVVAHGRQPRPHLGLAQRHVAERLPMRIGDFEEALQEFFRLGPAADGAGNR